MSLNSLVFGLSALACASVSWATEVACPQVRVENGKTARLISASLFDGPPAEMMELVPDLETYEWPVADLQAEARLRHRPLVLVCKYRSQKGTIKLTVPFAAQVCKVGGTRARPVALCR